MKMVLLIFVIILIAGMGNAQIQFAPAGTYLGEFTIGESFVDETIDFGGGSPPMKVSIIYCGATGDTILLFMAFTPENPNLMAPGYRVIGKSKGANWSFVFGFGVKGDSIFTIQLVTGNKIKIWKQ